MNDLMRAFSYVMFAVCLLLACVVDEPLLKALNIFAVSINLMYLVETCYDGS